MMRGHRLHLLCTFPLVVRQDRRVLHDVDEEESSARLTARPHAAAQLGPERGLEGEVPRGGDAVLS